MKSIHHIAKVLAKSSVCFPMIYCLTSCGLQEKSKSKPAPTVTPSGKDTDATANSNPCPTPTGGTNNPSVNPVQPGSQNPNNGWNNSNNNGGYNPWDNPYENGQPGPWGNPNDNSGSGPWENPYENGQPAPWGNPDSNGGPAPWENPYENGQPGPWGYPDNNGGPYENGPWNWGGPEAPVLRNISVSPRGPVTGQAPGSNPTATPCTPKVQDSGVTPVTGKPSFQQVAPVLAKSCGGSNCHSNGSRYGAFVGNQSSIDASKARIYDAVASGRMPKYGALSTQDKNLILAYTRP